MHRRQFEWDPEKDQNNQKKHGISLETATAIFDDPMLYEYADSEHSGYNKYGVWENRYIAIGWVSNVLFVVYNFDAKIQNIFQPTKEKSNYF